MITVVGESLVDVVARQGHAELTVTRAGDHIHERLADDSDHAIIPLDGAPLGGVMCR